MSAKVGSSDRSKNHESINTCKNHDSVLAYAANHSDDSEEPNATETGTLLAEVIFQILNSPSANRAALVEKATSTVFALALPVEVFYL